MGQRTGRPKYGNEKFFNRPVKETFLTLDKPVIGLAINWIRMGGWVAYSEGERSSMDYSA